MSDKKYQRPTTLSEAWSNRRYHGKIVVAGGGEVHSTSDPDKAVKLLQKLERKYPDQQPQTTIIPKDETTMLLKLKV